jgi:hypothetical protein
MSPELQTHAIYTVTRSGLRAKMLAAGWSPDEISAVDGALVSKRLHDNYLRAGYSPDEIERLTSLY